jgi:GNAT superfamily N-acetyltransferase
MKIRAARPADLDRVIPAYAAACADEAVTTWIKAASSAADFTAGFHDWLAESLDDHEVLIAETPDGAIVGVSTWMTVNSAEPLRQRAAALTKAAAADIALQRVAAAISLPHPDTPHLYLASMAVLPTHRSQGVGSAILRHRLTQADSDHQPVYLEASTARSAALYTRHRFTPSAAPIPLPHNGPHLHPMWRTPTP